MHRWCEAKGRVLYAPNAQLQGKKRACGFDSHITVSSINPLRASVWGRVVRFAVACGSRDDAAVSPLLLGPLRVEVEQRVRQVRLRVLH